jgi:hypothetical protein
VTHITIKYTIEDKILTLQSEKRKTVASAYMVKTMLAVPVLGL